MNGWIKLHRKFTGHWLYESKEPFTKREAWIDILLHVNYTDQKVNIGNSIIECGIGQSVRSLDKWASMWKWNKSKVRRFFKLLESDSMIVTESVKKTTRLTVLNFETYQVERNDSETILKRSRNDSETIATPNKKEKKVKEGEEGKKIKRFSPPTLEQVQSYCTERNNFVDPESFIDYYTSNDWRVGRNKMKCWKSAVRTWEKNSYGNNRNNSSTANHQIDPQYEGLPF